MIIDFLNRVGASFFSKKIRGLFLRAFVSGIALFLLLIVLVSNEDFFSSALSQASYDRITDSFVLYEIGLSSAPMWLFGCIHEDCGIIGACGVLVFSIAEAILAGMMIYGTIELLLRGIYSLVREGESSLKLVWNNLRAYKTPISIGLLIFILPTCIGPLMFQKCETPFCFGSPIEGIIGGYYMPSFLVLVSLTTWTDIVFQPRYGGGFKDGWIEDSIFSAFMIVQDLLGTVK